MTRALRFNGPEDVELIETPMPEPAANEALVRVEVSAICGSELHMPPGVNGGHEAAGTVVQAPHGSGFDPDERVGISAVTGCGHCDYCRRGVQLYCANGWHVKIGMHADYVATPVSSLRHVPAGMSALDAALISGDALGVPVRALRRVTSAAGSRVLIIGLGPVGLGHALVRAHVGAHVIAVEPSDYRRELGLTLGVAEAVEPGADIGPPPSLVIECTGVPECINLALDLVEVGGTVLQSGECPSVQVSPSETFIRREITYTGTWYYAEEDFPEMRQLYEDGLPIGRMVTHAFPADRIAEAYEAFVSKRSGKVVIDWGDA